MTVAELKAELDAAGIEYPTKARKAELEALLLGPDEAEAEVAEKIEEALSEAPRAWVPDWSLVARKLPNGAKPANLVRLDEPDSPPPHGGRWVYTEIPQSLKR